MPDRGGGQRCWKRAEAEPEGGQSSCRRLGTQLKDLTRYWAFLANQESVKCHGGKLPSERTRQSLPPGAPRGKE